MESDVCGQWENSAAGPRDEPTRGLDMAGKSEASFTHILPDMPSRRPSALLRVSREEGTQRKAVLASLRVGGGLVHRKETGRLSSKIRGA